MRQDPLNLNLEVWCANMEPKLHNLQKTVKIGEKNHQKTMFSYSFSKIMQFRLHISAPNFQIRIQWILAHLLTPETSGGTSIVE